ncbi:MAG: ATP-binding protein [Bacteroidales bacterium]|nr:ATP-binding protein [Bacteroidales bacterium]MCF6342247.1 ATP-binding protein [Bacteroidales bacterium]
MVFKHFRLQVVLRVTLIVINFLLILFIHQQTAYAVSAILLVLLFIAQIVALIRYVEQTNRKLTRFFESIRHADFTTSYVDNELGKSFEGLNREFNEVIEAFNKNKTEKEEHFNYLLTVIQHVSIGIIVYKHDGTVDVVNNSVKRLLRVNHLRNIKKLDSISGELPDRLLNMKAGDKSLVKLFVEDELIQLSIHTTQFRMRGEEYLLASFQDIHPELEQKEIESWQKLIRVLTHEIMNSITPISSLASTVKDILEERKENNPPQTDQEKEMFEDVAQAISTIENRSRGLLNFVEIYRNLTRIPKPHFRYFSLQQLVERALGLMEPKFQKHEIICTYKIFPKDLKVLADPDLVDQVIINLLLNAIDAVREVSERKITIVASVNLNNRTTVEIADSGKGISQDIMDKIFMPFFTSKQKGSGIGLSLSRQIMQMHKGSVSVRSRPGEGAVFTLVF